MSLLQGLRIVSRIPGKTEDQEGQDPKNVSGIMIGGNNGSH